MTRAIVLAGGRARRMNGPKILAPLGEGTVLGRVLAACAPGPVVLAGPPQVALAIPAGLAAVLVQEDPPFGGPVAGLRAALAALPPGSGPVAVLAGDQPFLDAAGVQALCSALATEQRAEAAAYADARGELQFLSACWREEALRRRVAAAGASMRSVYAGATVIAVADLREVTLDVDTPAELAAARERAAGNPPTP